MSSEMMPFTTQTMTSREIAELTGKRHDNVIRDLQILSDQGVIDLLRFEEISKDTMNRDQTTYRLPKRETLILTSGYSAIQRASIIDRWLELEAHAAKQDFPIPKTLHEALRLAADLAETTAKQSAQISVMEPKADFHDRVTQSQDLMTISEAAKLLRTGERRLFGFLRREGLLMKSNIPYQAFMDRGLFRLVETPWTDQFERERISVKTCLTQKGLVFVQGLQDRLAMYEDILD